MQNPAREERLKSALRDNLKRRKSQARGRAGTAIVTPDDDARMRDEELGTTGSRRPLIRGAWPR
jgi:hypothetical protein